MNVTYKIAVRVTNTDGWPIDHAVEVMRAIRHHAAELSTKIALLSPNGKTTVVATWQLDEMNESIISLGGPLEHDDKTNAG